MINVDGQEQKKYKISRDEKSHTLITLSIHAYYSYCKISQLHLHFRRLEGLLEIVKD